MVSMPPDIALPDLRVLRAQAQGVKGKQIGLRMGLFIRCLARSDDCGESGFPILAEMGLHQGLDIGAAGGGNDAHAHPRPGAIVE